MKKSAYRTRVLVTALAVVGVLAVHAVIRAADHADSPDTSEGNLDVNDLYVFNQGDNVVFAMTVSPLLSPGASTTAAALNPNGLYQFKLDAERDGIEEAVIQIVVSGEGTGQQVDVRGPVAPAVTGTTDNVLAATPSARGAFNTTFSAEGLTVFAGPRDDPFFIDLFGDESLTSVLNAVFSGVLGETIGSPDEQTLSFADPAMDDLAGLNVLAIVVEVPKSMVAGALGIGLSDAFFAWATTSTRQ